MPRPQSRPYLPGTNAPCVLAFGTTITSRRRAAFRQALLDGAHAVLARIVLELREPELLHERRDVHREPPAITLPEAVPAADGVVRRACPGLDRPLRGGLLLVGG